MLFLANELWPLAAAAAWIALGVVIAGAAVAGRKREGPRRGAPARLVRSRTVHGSNPLRAKLPGTVVDRPKPSRAGEGIRVRPARRLFFERAPRSGGMGPSLGRVS